MTEASTPPRVAKLMIADRSWVVLTRDGAVETLPGRCRILLVFKNLPDPARQGFNRKRLRQEMHLRLKGPLPTTAFSAYPVMKSTLRVGRRVSEPALRHSRTRHLHAAHHAHHAHQEMKSCASHRLTDLPLPFFVLDAALPRFGPARSSLAFPL